MKFFMCYCNIFLYIKYWREKNKNPDPELHLDLYLGLDPDPYWCKMMDPDLDPYKKNR